MRATAPSHASLPSSSALSTTTDARVALTSARTSSSWFSACRPGAVTMVSSRSAPAFLAIRAYFAATARVALSLREPIRPRRYASSPSRR